MKIALVILLSGMILCGCSQKDEAPTWPAIDRVQPGKDVIWAGGYVLHVEKRDGMAVEGIKVIFPKSIVTADYGALSPGSPKDSSDTNSVTIILTNATSVITSDAGTIHETEKRLPILLHE